MARLFIRTFYLFGEFARVLTQEMITLIPWWLLLLVPAPVPGWYVHALQHPFSSSSSLPPTAVYRRRPDVSLAPFSSIHGPSMVHDRLSEVDHQDFVVDTPPPSPEEDGTTTTDVPLFLSVVGLNEASLATSTTTHDRRRVRLCTYKYGTGPENGAVASLASFTSAHLLATH